MGQTSDAAPGSLMGGGGGQDGYSAQQYSQARRQRALLLPLMTNELSVVQGSACMSYERGVSLVYKQNAYVWLVLVLVPVTGDGAQHGYLVDVNPHATFICA